MDITQKITSIGVYVEQLECLYTVSENLKWYSPWDFPGGPVIKTPSSYCRGSRFDALSVPLYSCCVLWVVRCSQAQLQWETSLRVKLQRAEKNLAAETKLEPCLNHTQSLPCHWAYSVVPANNHLISVI